MKEDIGKYEKERQSLLDHIRFDEQKKEADLRETDLQVEMLQQQIKSLEEQLGRQKSVNKDLNDHVSKNMEQIMVLQREAQKDQIRS